MLKCQFASLTLQPDIFLKKAEQKTLKKVKKVEKVQEKSKDPPIDSSGSQRGSVMALLAPSHGTQNTVKQAYSVP